MIPQASDIMAAVVLVLLLGFALVVFFYSLKVERIRLEKDGKLKDLQIEWLQRVLGSSEKNNKDGN